MPLDLAKFRAWARIPHTEDDPAIGIAWAAAVRELEERTGWVVDPTTRTQYVGVEPTNTEKLVLLSRQPVTQVVSFNESGFSYEHPLVTINGLQYAKLDREIISGVEQDATRTYPLLLTVNCGSANPKPPASLESAGATDSDATESSTRRVLHSGGIRVFGPE